MTFCTDIDLLHWEPRLLMDATFASQTLISGTGDLTNTTFTSDAGVASFIDSHIQADQVLCLGPGAVSGCFPIVSVNSSTQLTISALYDKLFPISSDEAPEPTNVGTAADLPFVVRTYWPQRRLVSDLLLQAAGMNPAKVAANPSLIINPGSLRRACALGTLQMIYSSLSAPSEDQPAYQVRADLYERLYRRAVYSARLELDLNGDGETDSVRQLNVLRFRRT